MDAHEKGKTIQCSLCGATFVPGENTCGGCALRKDCGLICCPNCGFEMPAESKLINWFREHVKGSE